MALTRHQDWETRLHHHTENTKDAHHVWGSADCSTHVADAVLAQTGVDLCGDSRGKYHDRASADKFLAEATGKTGATLEDYVDMLADKHDLLKYPLITFASRGDIVIYESPTTGEQAAGIVTLDGVSARIIGGERGFHRVPVLKCKCAYAIDRGKAHVVHPNFAKKEETKI